MRATLFTTCAAALAITGCGGAQPPDFRDLDQLQLEAEADPGGGAEGEGEARDPDEKARIDRMLASEASSAPAGEESAAASASQVPWQFDTNQQEGEAIDEASKQPTAASSLPDWIQDPMTSVTDRERNMAALSVVTYGKRGAELDRILAERGMDRAQAVAEYRQLADDHPRGGPYTEQMYEYQSWAVRGESIPSF